MAPSPNFFRGLYRRVTQKRNKVFVIGFHKTGTTSLAKALLVLGYRVCGFVSPPSDIKSSTHTKKEVFESTYKPLLDGYDAFEDTMWFIFFKELAEMYPDAKFILTIRPEEKWYASMVKHFGGYERELFQWIYDGKGDPVGNKDLYIQKYREHINEVRQYFSIQKHDLLEMHMPEDFSWEVLCDFLECSKPFGSFPHANSASSRLTFQRKVLDHLKSKYYKYKLD